MFIDKTVDISFLLFNVYERFFIFVTFFTFLKILLNVFYIPAQRNGRDGRE